MRVISGNKKGHILKRPKNSNIRPTQDRVKESLFNILGYIPGTSQVLDLFSGSGSIGIEFLSRGAKECHFIDNSKESIRTIKKNLTCTKLTSKAFVYKVDAFMAMKKFSKKGIKFDYIFVDPPYFKGFEDSILEELCNTKIIKENGIIIIEHSKKNILKDSVNYLIKNDSRNYGDKCLTFYKKS